MVDIRPGAVLGQYRLERELGRGGMAVVYLATQPSLNRTVAVKLMSGSLVGEAEFRARFRNEATVVARLMHPNILPVYDYGEVDGTYYIVMAYVPGGSLDQRLKSPIEIPQVVRLTGQIAEALEFAHGQGVIHRDVKPSNILLGNDGSAWLADFGIARIVESDVRLTRTGAGIGTPEYMSPEQGRGDKVLDGRSDLYSLGAVLYLMLTGTVPFRADSSFLITLKHLQEPVPLPSVRRPGLSKAWDRFILQALAKDPAHRFQTGSQFKNALEQTLGESRRDPGFQTMAPPSFVLPPASVPPSQSSYAPPAAWQPSPPPSPPSVPYRSPERDIEAPPEPKRGSSRIGLLAGVGSFFAAVCCFGGAALAFSGAAPGVQPGLAGLLRPSQSATATPERSATPLPAATTAPRPTVAVAAPTATFSPPGLPYSRITAISIAANRYSVTFETFGYKPQLPGQHVHFFFDTVHDHDAGVPGAGPWILYGGPSPFTEYTPADRPQGATQMCILVANPDHSVQLNTGNCFKLP